MKLAVLAPTIAPLTSIGGLGDVMRDLPKFLKRNGNDVIIITPDHNGKISNLPHKKIDKLKTKYNGTDFEFDVIHTKHPAINIDIVAFSNKDFNTLDTWDPLKYDIFADLVVSYLDKYPVDCVSGHDWACGIAIAKCHEKLNLPTTMTIHNEAFKGPIIEYKGLVMSFLELGVYFSDAFNTVSPTHAEEIRSMDYICHQSKIKPYHGIINGIDFETFNSTTILNRMNTLCNNKLNPKEYAFTCDYGADDANSVKPKIKYAWLANKGILKYIEAWNNMDKQLISGTDVEIYGELNNKQKERNVPLFGLVGRATHQKGFDITIEAFSELFEEHNVQLVILAKGDENIEKNVADFAESYGGNVMALIGHCMPLSSIIYASSDWTVAPSLWEPCGLVQMESMAHCTPVIAREVGGLKDSIISLSPDPLNYPNFHEATGILFKNYDKTGLKWAVEHVLNWTYYRIKEVCMFLEYNHANCPESPYEKGSPLNIMMKNCYAHTFKNLSWQNNGSADKYKALFGGAIYTHTYGDDIKGR